MLAEYDFHKMKGGVCGKFAKKCREGSNIVILSPDVAQVFPTTDEVNQALRTLIKAGRTEIQKSYKRHKKKNVASE